MPARPRPERARTGAGRAAPREEGAQIGRPQLLDVRNAGRTAAMAGKKLEELARVALIGVEGQGSEPALQASILSQSARASRRSCRAEMRNSCMAQRLVRLPMLTVSG